MKKILLIVGLIVVAVATDYKSLSTEELVKMKGSVSEAQRDEFRNELHQRMSKMTPEERAKYSKNGNGQGMKKNQNGGMR
jgi:hypothetical protein